MSKEEDDADPKDPAESDETGGETDAEGQETAEEGGEAGEDADNSTEEDSENSGNEKEPIAARQDDGSATAALIESALKRSEREQQQREADRLEREKIALMTPEQKEAHDLKKEIEALKRERLNDKVQTAEMLDKMAIRSNPKLAPLYSKYEKQVEAQIAQLRSQGQFHNREAVLRYVLGGIMVDSYKTGKGPSKQKAAAKERIEKSTTGATTGRSQVKPNGKSDPNSREARAERLSNMRI